MNLAHYRDLLVDQLKTVPGARVYTDPLADIAPPGIIVSVPTLEWNSVSKDPTSGSFNVVYVVAASSRAADQLLAAVPLVTAAITNPNFVITSASPGVWNSGGAELPAYTFAVAL